MFVQLYGVIDSELPFLMKKINPQKQSRINSPGIVITILSMGHTDFETLNNVLKIITAPECPRHT